MHRLLGRRTTVMLSLPIVTLVEVFVVPFANLICYMGILSRQIVHRSAPLPPTTPSSLSTPVTFCSGHPRLHRPWHFSKDWWHKRTSGETSLQDLRQSASLEIDYKLLLFLRQSASIEIDDKLLLF